MYTALTFKGEKRGFGKDSGCLLLWRIVAIAPIDSIDSIGWMGGGEFVAQNGDCVQK